MYLTDSSVGPLCMVAQRTTRLNLDRVVRSHLQMRPLCLRGHL